ncbi:hypothetical protein [Actinomadura roseirufa]|uniref:hypothetical protein n=1 Tax=Actinomadura roseirufa TaxID=2094049 RepID=UPI0010413256|nr:hypothetical protein [Actinomadura roseirufa]
MGVRLLRRFGAVAVVPVLTIAPASVLPAGESLGHAASSTPGAATKGQGRTFATYQVVIGDPVTANPGRGQGAYAYCPAGTVVLGGGESNTLLLPTGAELVASNPDDVFNGWHTAFYNASQAVPVTLRTRVVCGSGIPGYQLTYLQDQIIPRGQTRREFSPSCPEGSLTLGGGSDGPQGLRLLDSYPGGTNQWETTVLNISLTSEVSTTLYNICGRGITRSLQLSDTVRVAKGGRANATATCPAGSKVLSGGGDSSPRGSNLITDTYPSSDGKTWTVYVKNIVDEVSWMRVRVLCGT